MPKVTEARVFFSVSRQLRTMTPNSKREREFLLDELRAIVMHSTQQRLAARCRVVIEKYSISPEPEQLTARNSS